MTQLLSINNNDKNLNAQDDLGYQEREEIIDSLVEQGLPRVFNPNTFIDRIAEVYSITTQEARSCLKEAIAQLEANDKQQEKPKREEKLYAQSGYFYPSANMNEQKEKDSMDSLVAFGAFQRLKFGL